MITLETAKIAFDTWRIERSNTSVPFPTTLWDMVKQLLSAHKKTEICKTLHISSNQIKRSCAENLGSGQASNSLTASKINSQPQQIPTCGDFVAATPAPQSFDPPTKEIMSVLTLTSSNKTLQLSIPISALPDVLPAFGALL